MEIKRGQTQKSAFTLIELLVVIAIIGILAALVYFAFSGAQARARDSQRKTDIVNLESAIKRYMIDNFEDIPYAGGGLCAPGTQGYAVLWRNLEVSLSPYLTGGRLPLDPRGKCNDPDEPWDGSLGSANANHRYGYYYRGATPSTNPTLSVSKYSLWLALENHRDADTNSFGKGDSEADPFNSDLGKYNRIFFYRSIQGWSTHSDDNIHNIYGKGMSCDLNAQGTCAN